MSCCWGCACSGDFFLPTQQLLELGVERRRDVLALARVGHVGGEEAALRAAVEGAAFELEPIERLPLGELDHGVGELNLAARAALLGSENLEDLRLQDVA